MTKITAVLGNSQKLDGGSMFGNAPRPVWEKWIAPDDVGRIPLACRTLLIEHNGEKILCETGIGAFFEPKLAERFGVQNPDRHMLVENLQTLGVNPEDIHHIVLSHLHFDHAGGLLPTFKEMQDGKKGLAFPNAKIITSKVAYERAVNPHPRDKASFVPELMKRLKDADVQLIDEPNSTTLFSGHMHFYTSNGHTPGQLHTLFTGDNESVVFCADLIPGRPWVHTPITMGYDRYPELLIDEKEKLYSQVALEKTNFFFTHDPDIAMSKVEKDEKGKYKPLNEVATPTHWLL
jgi:glyoxylase-like metal-dependent hydrolase (beta-lactamase superfamily II)